MRVFLLAHPDDEIFTLPYVLNSENKLFVYLTNGTPRLSDEFQASRRLSEAKDLFEKHLRKYNSKVIWWGNENSVSDGDLHNYFNRRMFESLIEILRNQNERVTEIITTSFEGAHQDHDCVAIIARRFSKSLDCDVVEVSTYPQLFDKFYSFKVMSPRTPLAKVKFKRISVMYLAIKLISGYKTQRLTWLGLGLPALISYCVRDYCPAEPEEVKPLSPCFYEFRGRARQVDVLKKFSWLI
jgi:hypothetical protein